MSTDPIARFRELLERAIASEIAEPTAMTLATADRTGRVAARMVLLKGVDERGFVFFTNLESRKARDIEQNPRAALCFFWQPLEVQIRVEGDVVRVSDEESDEYFATRPRGSQAGAWASLQSRPLESRDELDARVSRVMAEFAGKPIPRPDFWAGLRVIPDRIEFWTGQPSRLHYRDVFVKTDAGAWKIEHLYP